MKRAFTLIELLVAIAIIAILAAILFPVFAQAKQAAKKTASLSNNKQVSLGAIMYSGDVDDTFTPASTQLPGATSGGTINYGSFRYTPWPALINPYVKNYDLFTDPQAQPGKPTTLGYPADAGKAVVPHYGINPYLLQQVSFPYPATGPTYSFASPMVPRSYTSISRPADTVFSAAKYSSSETTGSWTGDWWFGAGTYFIPVSVDPPECAAPGNVFVCAAGWGDNGFYGGTGGTKFLNNVEAAGAWTGGSSLRGTRRMIVSFVDGHVASQSPERMAEGTTYNPAKGANGIPTQTQAQVVINTQANGMSVEKWFGLQ